MTKSRESVAERQRREWTERQERFKDKSEEFDRDRATASTPEERDQLSQAFAAYRRAHREEDIRRGKRQPGPSLTMRQNMWARWIEVAVDHELEGRRGYRDLVAKASSDGLLREFRASLVAVTAAAYTIEAVFGDIKYLIPEQTERKRDKKLSDAFRSAFGVSGEPDKHLAKELRWLFALRDWAVHPFTESVPPAVHPAGVKTGVEHSLFNSYTSKRAVDSAMVVLELAGSPPAPSIHWIERWVVETAGHHPGIQRLRADRDKEPLP